MSIIIGIKLGMTDCYSFCWGRRLRGGYPPRNLLPQPSFLLYPLSFRDHPKGGQIIRKIAQSLIESEDIALGAFGRRLRAKKGPAIAIKAVARKLAETYWRVMVKGIDYAEIGIKQYEEQLLANKRKSLDRLANELNVQIANKQPVVV